MLNNVDVISFFEQLSVFNKIKFSEEGHSYTVDGKQVPLSVTRLIGIFKPEFDRDKISSFVAKKTKQSVENVLKGWDLEKDIACVKGSLFHNYIDNYLANKKCKLDFSEANEILSSPMDRINFYHNFDKIISQFDRYYTDILSKDFIHVGSEFVVGDINSSNICGTIDNLSINKKTGNLAIIDYKTNKKIDTDNKYGSFLVPPLDHLKDCKLVIYSLQLGIYKYILEKNTPYTVDTCNIVWFNENNSTYQVFDVLDLSREVCTMFSCYESYSSNTILDNTSLDIDI